MTQQREVREIGIPVRAARNGSLHAGVDENGKDCLYAMMQQESGKSSIFVLQIDIETGHCRRFDAPPDTGGGPVMWSKRWGRFFFHVSVEMGGNARLLQLDPQAGRFEDLGLLRPEGRVLASSIDEAPDGTIYLGTYGRGCPLFSYRPDTGKFVDYGPMDKEEFYFYVSCGADGTVAGLTKMARPHVVVLDPETGEHHAVGPVADTDKQQGHVALSKGADGLLYINSHEGIFRLEGTQLTPVDAIPQRTAPPALPDGSTFRFLDARQDNVWLNRYRTIGIDRPDGSRKVIELDYEAEGTAIYIITEATDGKIYGSSILPLHFFSLSLIHI